MPACMVIHPSAQCAVDAAVIRVLVPCREHVHIELLVPEMPPSWPGQFLQLQCSDDPPAMAGAAGGDADFRAARPYLRRPFSIADRWDDTAGTHLVVISRTVGPGTRWLAEIRPGNRVNLTGPLGRGFRIPADPRPVLLVGGGVGIPPLLYTARVLCDLGWPEVRIVLGARRRDLLCVHLLEEPAVDGAPTHCVELPGRANYPTTITSDDGSVGLPGQVSAALERVHRLPEAAAPPLVLACGPDAMLRSVAATTAAWGWGCQLCIEKNMSCGIGTCLSCVVRVVEPSRVEGWRWGLTCTEGPVFERDELLDYRPAPG
jgi:dihydroorotate dehydrogenase electron transfer subunit